MGIKCPECNTENPSDSKYCKECSASLSSLKEIPFSPTKTLQIPTKELPRGTTFAGRYQVIEEIGRGGMGVVYKAEDTRLKRTVALKFLPPELTGNKEAKERFVREAQAAAALDHPNICTVHEIDEAEEKTFISMAYIEGQSLKEKVEQGLVEIDEALDIAIQVAEGLEEAHKKGVVHRDIKSANIMVTGKGQAKIMDFGLAKVVGGSLVTKEGTTMGTVAYMSPEQARGEKVGYCTDIWSLGVVLYEILTGELPFKSEHEQAVIYSILKEDTKAISALRNEVPSELDTIVMKCLEKKPSDRYRDINELLADLYRLRGKPLGFGLSWILARRKIRSFVLPGIIISVVIIVLIGAYLFFTSGKGTSVSDRPRLVVLPFENLSSPDDEYYADGITEEITSRLAEISGLQVVSRTSAMRLKKHEMDIQQIGSELNVEYLLEGTIRTDRSPDGSGQVRVIPQLIRVSDDVNMWTQRYTANLMPGEIFQVQAKIAEQVAGALNVTLLEQEQQAIVVSSTEDKEAHNEYLLGKFQLWKRTPEGLQLAAEHFNRAIARDPNFARAYSGLADAYILFPRLGVSSLSRDEAYAKAEKATRRAIALDDNLAEAHTSLALVRMRRFRDWAGAEREFQRAIALNPDYSDAHYFYGMYLTNIGRLEEAVEQTKRTVALDPLSGAAHQVLGRHLYLTRRNDEALVEFLKAVELEPTYRSPHLSLIVLYVDQGLLDEAVREAESVGFPKEFTRSLIKVLAGQTSKEVAATVIAQVQEALGPVYAGVMYSKIGLNDHAFTSFEEAFRIRDDLLPDIIRHPWLDGLRSDPRFTDLLLRMGLK